MCELPLSVERIVLSWSASFDISKNKFLPEKMQLLLSELHYMDGQVTAWQEAVSLQCSCNVAWGCALSPLTFPKHRRCCVCQCFSQRPCTACLSSPALLVTCSPCSSLCHFSVETFFQRIRSKVGALQRRQYTVTSTPWLQLQLPEDSAKEDIQSQNPSTFVVTRTVDEQRLQLACSSSISSYQQSKTILWCL